MGRQRGLVLLLLCSWTICQLASAATPFTVVKEDIKNNEIDTDISEEEPLLPIHKMDSKVKSTTIEKKTKIIRDDLLQDLITASKHSPALAADARLHQMLPDKMKLENSTQNTNKSDEYLYYDYNEDYDDDYDNYEETTSPETNKKTTSTTPKQLVKKNKHIEMKPIKEENFKPKLSFAHDLVQPVEVQPKPASKVTDNHIEKYDDYKEEDGDDKDLDDEDEEEDEDDEDDIADEDVIYSKKIPCPRYCVCARNVNSYLVATCSRFDPGTQKFGSDITDLIVSDVGPKYPILLGPQFFLQMGLKHVSSIKISNCTIEYVHPEAFHGLDELYSVNLTNVGLAIFNPDTFSTNKKLRLLTISGNELSVMSSLHYLLKSTTIEELDLSRNNLVELNPNAFSQLTSIVYINLSQNNIAKLPENVFDPVETLEELDLSYNSLQTLPETIFNKTSLAILHLKYNSISHDLHFGTSDLQQLDLSYNTISAVHHGMFDKMTDLTNLNLRGNLITKISPDSLLTLRNLRHIDLSVNKLDQVSSMLFYKNSELDVIRLNDNARLTHLPTDGFLCYNGYFTAYYLDISNCAIGALGHKTFSTMPHLNTLKMSWNNINNLERDTFATLTKLNDLDLSNNLITRLDDQLFNNNNDLTKLNLSGNTIRKLSARLFQPLHKLRELDVSDCELTALLADMETGAQPHKFFETLRSFNASANQIKEISAADVKQFENLHTLDITRNPLKCNEQFKNFISYVALNTMISPNSRPMSANVLDESTVSAETLESRDWGKLAMQICKHTEDVNYKTKTVDIVKQHKEDADLEKRLKDETTVIDDDDLLLMSMMEKHKFEEAKRILKGKHQAEEMEKPKKPEVKLAKDVDNEENESDYDEEEEDDAAYDDDNDDEYDTVNKKQKGKKHEQGKIIDHGVKVEEIDLRAETKDKFLINKFLLNGDDAAEDNHNDDLDNDEEEIIIERGRIYYSGYKFMIPIIVIILGLLALLLVIAKIVSMIMRRRGERYRMALLAASKNSIVYQKLTEDIKASEKEHKQPKVHRYAPINQV